MSNLNRKMAKGASWLILFRLLDRGIGFVSTLILARLLMPADFGLIAMAMSILALVAMLSTFSFDIALIQNANAERRHYDTAWTFNIIFGFANALALIALALPVASFYHEPRLVSIMMVIAATCFVQGFGNIGVVAFQKDLALHKEFVFGLAKRMVGFFVTVALAYFLRSYWALIVATLVSSIVGVALSYYMHPFRPRLSLLGRQDLFHFSKWLLLNNLLVSLTHRAPDFVIGKVAGPASLGLYTVAYEISNLPTTELVFPISRAVFPAYSKMAGDLAQLRQGFLDVLSVILLVTVPAGIGIVVLAEPFVHVLLGAKWAAAVPLIKVLGIFGVLRASGSNIGGVYLALGRPRLQTYQALVFLGVLFPGLVWLTGAYGAIGASYAVLLAAAVQVPVGFAMVMTQINLHLKSVLAVMWRPVAAASIMACAVSSVSGSLVLLGGLAPNYSLQLATLVPFGAVVYAVSVFGLWFVSGRAIGGESKLLSMAGLAIRNLRQRRATSAKVRATEQ